LQGLLIPERIRIAHNGRAKTSAQWIATPYRVDSPMRRV
jgi:hypothetical protein